MCIIENYNQTYGALRNLFIEIGQLFKIICVIYIVYTHNEITLYL